MKNMKRIKDKFRRFFQERYGMDELGKMLLIASAIWYVLGALLKSSLLFSICLFLLIFGVYRMLSKQHWDRGEENRKYNQHVKLWKMRYQERKTSRIYLCKRCGKLIRVPKGRGKIQITCPNCGSKVVKRT